MAVRQYYSVLFDGDGHLILSESDLTAAQVAEIARNRRVQEDRQIEIRGLLRLLVAHAEVANDERITLADVEGICPGE